MISSSQGHPKGGPIIVYITDAANLAQEFLIDQISMYICT